MCLHKTLKYIGSHFLTNVGETFSPGDEEKPVKPRGLTFYGQKIVDTWPSHGSVAMGTCVHSATKLFVRSDEVVWSKVGVLVHHKGVQWGWGQGYVQDPQVLPLQPWHTASSQSSLSGQGLIHAGTFLDALFAVKQNYKVTANKDIRSIQLCASNTVASIGSGKSHLWVWWSGVPIFLPL